VAEALLVACYGEAHRAYHDLTHITEVLGWFDVVADEVGWESPRDVYDAILFHDAIYDPKAHDNEARSAALARSRGCSARTADLIELTARHGKLTAAEVDRISATLCVAARPGEAEAFARDAAHFLDCDTAILGAAPDAFDAYDAAIAIEYDHVPPDAFRAGRGAFLRTMRDRPRLFLSDFFHARLDAAARANLDRVIAARYT